MSDQEPKEALQKNVLSFEERMKIATISENTRSYLIILGKLSDTMGDLNKCVVRDYGDEQADSVVGSLYDDFSGLTMKIRDLVMTSIYENVMLVGGIEI